MEPPVPVIGALAWESDALRALEQETIYLRERLRARAEALVAEAGRQRVTLADLDRARRMSGHAPVPALPAIEEPPWPVTFGSYRVLDPTAPVAICTLASEALMAALAEARPGKVAIVGRAFTENFGVEKVVTNLVANPHVRVLVLCGVESRHKVGETLLALHASGVDDTGRVVGSTSPLPIVRSLAPEAIRIYQAKLQIIDLRGENRLEPILQAVAGCPAPEPWPEQWMPQVPVVRLPAGGSGAGMGSRFSPDPTGLFLIGIGPSGRTIHAEHYTREGVLDAKVIGDRAEAIARAIADHGLVGDVRHALYLGRELQKAELALRLGLEYEQDRDLALPEQR